jgi:hypothetical protein
VDSASLRSSKSRSDGNCRSDVAHLRSLDRPNLAVERGSRIFSRRESSQCATSRHILWINVLDLRGPVSFCRIAELARGFLNAVSKPAPAEPAVPQA